MFFTEYLVQCSEGSSAVGRRVCLRHFADGRWQVNASLSQKSSDSNGMKKSVTRHISSIEKNSEIYLFGIKGLLQVDFMRLQPCKANVHFSIMAHVPCLVSIRRKVFVNLRKSARRRASWSSYIGHDVQTKNPFTHVRIHDVDNLVYDFPLF